MSNETFTSKSPAAVPAISHPHPHAHQHPPLRKVLPKLLLQVVVGIAIASGFVGLYVGLQRQPTPHGLPIAVVGADAARAVASGLGDRVAVHEAGDLATAKDLVRTHRVVAAISPASRGLALWIAGADGKSATGAATGIATAIAQRNGGTITSVTDLVPLSRYDTQGLSGFYLVFGSTLAAFIVAQTMNGLAALARLRNRVVILLLSVAGSATAAAVLAGPVYGAVPAFIGIVIPILALLGAAVALSTLAITRLVGPLGNVLATLLFTTLGNSTSGATTSSYLLPPSLSAIGAAFPPGAAFRAVVDFGYYGGRDALGPVLILAAWIAAASLLLPLVHRIRPAATTTPPHTGAHVAARA